MEACFILSPSVHTRRAYWTDTQRWLEFCRSKRIDPSQATAIVVAAWVESMKREPLAPKTRNRRLSALSSVYDWLRRHKGIQVNPFSSAEGPKRESSVAVRPTPIAEARDVLAAIKGCEADLSFKGVRDAAIMRVLWVTGARRSSLIEITHERLSKESAADGSIAYHCVVSAKRGKTLRLWFAGKAATAITSWMVMLKESGIKTGPIFRMTSGSPMTERDVWRAVKRRGREVGAELMPHSFRVAFLTINPASLDERQDAAGHASPTTTRMYDRNSWRGKKAFSMMPEVEDVVAGNVGASTDGEDKPE